MLPASDFTPVYRPSITLRPAAGRIEVDGDLGDEGWRNAARTDRFVERSPGDMTPPAVRTEVLVTYDKANLYVGFICDDDPRALRATMTRRDAYSGDDCAIVLIDTYGNAASAYEFFVNPYGVQKDILWTPTVGEDASFDLVWRSAAQVTPEGYRVEIAIPFSGLRFPQGAEQSWRVDFWRNRPRASSFQYSWAAYNRSEQCWPCQWGTVEGIADVAPGKGVELLATAVANQSGQIVAAEGYPFDNEKVEGEMSLAGKYAVTSGMTVEATWNPDFSQIESDAAQIDINSTIDLLYPERRPFFQEGADIFQTLFNSFSSRTIWDPRYAAKLTGRAGRWRLGFLSARDENSPYTVPLEESGGSLRAGASTVNVLRGSLSFGQDSRGGFILTDRRYDWGGYGTVASLDADIRLSRNYSWVGQVVASYTGEPDRPELFGQPERFEGMTFDNGKHTVLTDGESFSGNALITQFRRQGRHLNFRLNYDQVDPTYRTQTGYDPWNDYRNAFVNAYYLFYGEGRLIERLAPNIYVDRRWNYDGRIKWTHGTAGLEANFRFWQSYASLTYTAGDENWGGVQFDGLYAVRIGAGGVISNALAFNGDLSFGRDVAVRQSATGNQVTGGIEVDLKPLDRLMIEPSYTFTRSRHVATDELLYEQHITRTRVQFQATRELSLRLVVQYNDGSERWDIDPLLSYQLSPFSVFYVGTTYDYQNLAAGTDEPDQWRMSSRRFFLKLQYLFQT
ncbi:MAG TPA: carbohydrate binding family 9 domain-containing protein [candidate division Zixibacteria bacterium]|nr:carbohydrate binding family 9 domain-containing protein [candidate division Zixibacteria bacterium]HOD65149.1 carbohydrate binding family 9 domain-containing protein [candidate division Zixibacteria bacterium]HOZ07023.1 carbohydrate binding family 9 domain-containing protein [candidate division Zixibacteria bacterium]HQL24067.1 carbohydrate binding family 9 domain-containing protein [candidate division Zixibacteria bacterium]